MRKPFVVGAGTMGAGIGQLCAQQGFSVTIADVTEELVGNARQKIIRGFDQRIEKGKVTAEEKEAVLARMSWATDLGAARESDFVIEAASENLELKKKLFRELDGICPPETVLTTNTTALSISEIASATRRPEKVVGMHFFNPAVVMKLVEIIRGSRSSEATIAAARQFAEKLGRIPIVTAKEAPAGIVSRVLAGLLNEAAAVYEAGIASAQDIDEAMKLGAGLPMGPLALMDMIGLDIHLAKMETLHQKLGDDRYKTPEIVREMVARGKLGRKTGEGFYKY
ncbi:MAG: 3-hydroxyacyl-CoA dehydrogenase NAD-binding domain-containing protein [Candidatus Aminicenantes bacterium]|nr:3-hydroxyacyl-CoA dehydrogenase NAD-binding domain-containing protein [Candidatus Aminicenantes bacterium]